MTCVVYLYVGLSCRLVCVFDLLCVLWLFAVTGCLVRRAPVLCLVDSVWFWFDAGLVGLFNSVD